MDDISNFLYSYGRYHGEFKPENLVFNANLQEFAQRVSLISNLETNGKLTPSESFREIELLWRKLKDSKRQLGIGKHRDERS